MARRPRLFDPPLDSDSQPGAVAGSRRGIADDPRALTGVSARNVGGVARKSFAPALALFVLLPCSTHAQLAPRAAPPSKPTFATSPPTASPRVKHPLAGQVWIGERAVNVGLADSIGHLVPVMKARFGDMVRFRRFGQRRPFLSRFGLSLAEEATGLLEERAAFARFGL